MLLCSNRSQTLSECGKSKKCAFSPHFDIFCDPLLNRHAVTMNLFELYHKEVKKSTVTSIVSVLQQIIDNDQLIETNIGLSLLYKL
mgnify:CR=1 FL=1